MIATLSTPSRRLLNTRYASPISLEREPVGQQRCRIEPARLDHLDQPAHPLLAAGAERGDDPVVAEARGERRRTASRACPSRRRGSRACRRVAAQRSALSNVCCVPSASMATSAPCRRVSRLTSSTTSTLREVEHDVGAHPLRHREPHRVAVDADDLRGAHQLRAGGRAQTDRPLGEHDDGVADPDAARLGARRSRSRRCRPGARPARRSGRRGSSPGSPAPTGRAGTRPARRRSCCRTATRRSPRSRRRVRTARGGRRGRPRTARTA